MRSPLFVSWLAQYPLLIRTQIHGNSGLIQTRLKESVNVWTRPLKLLEEMLMMGGAIGGVSE